MSDYIIYIDRDGSPYLEHAWKKHKYIAIKKGQYIYPEDLVKLRKNNYLAAKEQKAQTTKELKKATRSGNRDYKKINKTNTWLDKHKNDPDSKTKQKYQEKRDAQYDTYHKGKRERDEIRKREKMADALVDITRKSYFDAVTEADKAKTHKHDFHTQGKVEAALDKATDKVKNTTKSISDRMKEEFEKKQKERENKKQKYSDGTIEETVLKENIIPETVIKENIIPETVIEEEVIPETVIKEEKISEKVLKDASDHKESNAEKEYNRVKTLKDENKQRMDKILEEQDKIRPEINKYFDKYTDAIEKYGRGSEQAKIAEEKYLDKARPYAKLEREWQSRRKFNINYGDALEILEEAKKHG